MQYINDLLKPKNLLTLMGTNQIVSTLSVHT